MTFVNKATLFFLSLVVVLLFSIALSMINHSLFIEDVINEKYNKMFEAREIPFPDSTNRNVRISLDVDWPLNATIFYYSLLSLFWLAYGILIKKKFYKFPVYLAVAVPISFSLFLVDNYFLLYIVSCLAGYYGMNIEKRMRDRPRGK